MKNKFIVVGVHSFIDVITNSSTELFVIDKDNTVKAVEEMLKFMLEKWNELASGGAFGEYYVRNTSYSLKDGTKKPVPLKTFDDTFDVFIYTEEMYKGRPSGWAYEKKDNIGKIIIMGVGDNSIPYEMYEWIESAFGYGVKRYHLG